MAAPHPSFSLAPAVAQHMRQLVHNLSQAQQGPQQGQGGRAQQIKSVLQEAHSLVAQHGPDAHLALVRALAVAAEAASKQAGSAGASAATDVRWQVLASELTAAARGSNFFVSLVCRAFSGLESLQNGVGRLVFDVLQLSPPTALSALAAFSQFSEPLIAKSAEAALKKVLVMPSAHPQQQSLGLLKVENLQLMSEELLHLLLFVSRSRKDLQEEFQTLRSVLLQSKLVTPVLAPLVGAPAGYALAPSKLLSPAIPAERQEGEDLQFWALLQDFGYAAMENPTELRDLIRSRAGPLSARDVAMVVGMMARTHTGLHAESGGAGLAAATRFPPGLNKQTTATTWNVNIFCDVIKGALPHLNWDDVIANLDHPRFVLPDPTALGIVVNVYRRCKMPFVAARPLPLAPLLVPWSNTTGQLSLLRLAVAAPPGLFDWASESSRAVDATNVPLPAPSTEQQRVTQLPWRSLSLIEVLLRLAEVESYSIVRGIFEHPLQQFPDLLTLGLTQAQVPVGAPVQQQRVPAAAWNVLAAELFRIAIPRVIRLDSGAGGASRALSQRLWTRAPVHLVRAFVEGLAASMISSDSLEPPVVARLLAIIEEDIDPLQRQQQQSTAAALLVLSLAVSQLGAAGVPLVVELVLSVVARNLPWAAESHRWLRDVFLGQPGGASPQRTDEQRQIHLHEAITTARATLRVIEAKLARYGRDIAREYGVLQHLAPVFAALHAACVTSESPLPAPLCEAVKRLMPRFQAAMQRRQSESQNVRQDVAKQDLGGGDPQSMPPAMLKLNQALHGPDGNPITDPNAVPAQRQFGQETEASANAYIQRVYTGELSTDAVLQLLARFKVSAVEAEQSIFACMIFNLIDEYRFFPGYPDRQLRLTAILFGALVQKSLVSFLPLGLVLRCILDAVRKPSNSKMFAFGVTALQQFMPRLAEWPQYCSHILAIPHMNQVPEIVRFIESVHGSGQAASGSQPQVDGAGPAGFNRPAAGAPPGLSTDAAPPGLGPVSRPVSQQSAPQEIAVPTLPEDETDKIHFIFNNVSETNLRAKGTELLAIIGTRPEPLRYIAHYLVTKRVTSESNFQKLYVSFLEEVFGVLAEKIERERATREGDNSSPSLVKERPFNLIRRYTVEQTLVQVRELLSRESVQQSERTLLKNLGTWLGLWTLARDKPLLHKHLAPRSMIVDAYRNGRLIVVVPFVCKVLETATQSKTFMPPNPWTMSVLRALGDIYRLPMLKLNLKFEFEVLCKAFGTTPGALKATSLLANVAPIEDSPDFTPAPKSDSRSQAAAATASRAQGAAEAFQAAPAGPAATITGQPGVGALADGKSDSRRDVKAEADAVAAFVHISPQIPLFAQQPQLAKHVSVAVDRAIREIIGPVVERSVTIACITTKELVLKDFATESDPNQLRPAAHVMVQNLAGSLALVTCKEPLRVSVTNHLRSLLQQHAPEQYHPMIEQAVQAIATDNLDIACNFIEKAATEKAIHETDEGLQAAVVQRERFQEAHPERKAMPRPTELTPTTQEQQKSMFCDPAVFASRGGRWLAAMPEQLRPHFGGLLPSQLAVYEDFSRIPFLQQQLQSGASSGVGSGEQLLRPASKTGADSDDGGHGVADLQAQAPSVAAPPLRAVVFLPAVSQFAQLLQQLISEANGAPTVQQRAPLAQLPPEHAIHGLVRDAALLARQYSAGPEAATLPYPALPHTSLAAMARLGLSRLCDAVQQQQLQLHQPGLDPISALQRDAILAALEAVVSVNRAHLSNELTSWLLFLDSHQQSRYTVGMLQIGGTTQVLALSRLAFHRALVPVLLRRGVISASRYDAFVASKMEIDPAAAEFAAFVLAELVLKTQGQVLSATVHLPLTSAALRRLASSRQNEELVRDVDAAIAVSQQLPESRPRVPDDTPAFSATADPEEASQAIYRVFDSWVSAFTGWQQAQRTAAQVGALPADGSRPTPIEGESNVNPLVTRHRAAVVAAEGRARELLTMITKQLSQAKEDVSKNFFRVSCELAVERYLASRAAVSGQQAMNSRVFQYLATTPASRRELSQELMDIQKEAAYVAIDAFSALASLSCKEQANPQARISFFSRVLSLVVRLLITDYDSAGPRFQQRPYFRIFSNWMTELFDDAWGPPVDALPLQKGKKKKLTKKQQRLQAKNKEMAREIDSTLAGIHSRSTDPYAQSQLLVAFSTALVALCPTRLPGFSFAWLELVSHHHFVPRLLLGVPGLTSEAVDRNSGKTEDKSANALPLTERGWPLFQRLLVELFRFLTPGLIRSEPGRAFYDGAIRVAVMLLHDFPNFLADFHFSLCDAILPMCTQLRNIILSAHPGNFTLSDPLKVGLENSTEMRQAPRVLSPVAAALVTAEPGTAGGKGQAGSLKAELDAFLGRRAPATFLPGLPGRLLVANEERTRTNVPLLNAVVLYVGMQAAQRSGRNNSTTEAQASLLFETLMRGHNAAGRYLLVNAIVNQLRFPNAHTFYFANLLLSLFNKFRDEDEAGVSVPEQITRILIERVVAHRPHPWGLLATVVELMKNPTYDFWTMSFTRSSPEIERLLRSIADCSLGKKLPTTA